MQSAPSSPQSERPAAREVAQQAACWRALKDLLQARQADLLRLLLRDGPAAAPASLDSLLGDVVLKQRLRAVVELIGDMTNLEQESKE